MGEDITIKITAVRQSDDIHHVFLGENGEQGHITNRSFDCPCEPEVNIIHACGDTIRLFIHDFRVQSCR